MSLLCSRKYLQKLENFLGSDHTNKDELLDEIISILNKEVDIDEYVQDISDYCKALFNTSTSKIVSSLILKFQLSPCGKPLET